MATNKNQPALSVNVQTLDESVKVDMCHTILTLEFANGNTLEMDTRKLAPSVISHALAHGLKQKLVDAAAISRDPANGRAADINVKYHAVNEVFQRLMTGDWNKRREGGGNTGGLLFRALCEMYEGRKTPEQIKQFLTDKSDKDKAALRKNPKVAEIIERLRAEAAKDDGSEPDDLLAELEMDDGDDGEGSDE